MLIVEARLRARRYEHRELFSAVWHLGILPNVDSKKYPKHQAFIGDAEGGDGRPVAQKSPEQIRAAMTEWMFAKASPKPDAKHPPAARTSVQASR